MDRNRMGVHMGSLTACHLVGASELTASACTTLQHLSPLLLHLFSLLSLTCFAHYFSRHFQERAGMGRKTTTDIWTPGPRRVLPVQDGTFLGSYLYSQTGGGGGTGDHVLGHAGSIVCSVWTSIHLIRQGQHHPLAHTHHTHFATHTHFLHTHTHTHTRPHTHTHTRTPHTHHTRTHTHTHTCLTSRAPTHTHTHTAHAHAHARHFLLVVWWVGLQWAFRRRAAAVGSFSWTLLDIIYRRRYVCPHCCTL